MTTEKKDEAVLAGKEAADKVGEKKPQVTDKVAEELAVEAVKSEAKLSTGNESETETVNRWHGAEEINGWEHYLELSPDGLKDAVDKKDGIPEEKVAGLLILERNGKNRTEYVKLLMKRLGIKDIVKELPQAGGPGYTHDATNLSEL